MPAAHMARRAMWLFTACLLGGCAGLLAEQAGVNDWQKSQIGRVTSASLSGSRALVLTESNVLARINTKTGALAWRQVLPDGDTTRVLAVDKAYAVTVGDSGIVRFWDSREGGLLFESGSYRASPDVFTKSISTRASAEPAETRSESARDLPPGAAAFVGNDQAVVALNGVLTLFDIRTQAVVWTAALQLPKKYESLTIATGVVVSVAGARVQVAAQDATGQTVFVWSVDVESGAYAEPKALSTARRASQDTLAAVAGGVALLDAEKLILTVLRQGQDTVELQLEKEFSASDLPLRIVAESFSGLVVVTSASRAVVIRLDTLKVVKSIKSPPGAAYTLASAATVAQAYAADGKLFVNSFDAKNNFRVESASESVPFTQQGAADAIYATKTKKGAFRGFVVSGSSAMVSVQQGAWVREEGLASIIAAEFVSLPLPIKFTSAEGFPGFFDRLQLQMAELKDMAASAATKITDVLQGRNPFDFGSSAPESLVESDHFGMQQLVIALTKTGKVFALSTTTGAIVWSRNLKCPAIGGDCVWTTLSIIGQRGVMVTGLGQDRSSAQTTAVSVLNGVTGSSVVSKMLNFRSIHTNQLPLYTPVWSLESGPRLSESLGARFPLTMLVDTDSNVRVLPQTQNALDTFQTYFEQIYFRKINISAGVISGFAVAQRQGAKGYVATPLWEVNFPQPREEISAVASVEPEPVHSATQSTGDASQKPRRKYINRNLFAVATVKTADSNDQRLPGIPGIKPSETAVTVYLIDGVTGAIVNRVSQAHGKGPVNLVMSENFVAYHYYNSKSRQFEISVLEMFENERLRGKNAYRDDVDQDFFSSRTAPSPLTLQQTFLFPHPVRTLSVIKTKYGITPKLVLAGLGSHQLAGIGRPFLDARRPIKVDPKKRLDGVMPYHPLVRVDDKLVLSYNRTVWNIRGVASGPTQLESTSLVFAYGLDVFFTRVAASGTFDQLSADFNYPFLAASVSIVIALLITTRYLAERKKLALLWA